MSDFDGNSDLRKSRLSQFGNKHGGLCIFPIQRDSFGDETIVRCQRLFRVFSLAPSIREKREIHSYMDPTTGFSRRTWTFHGTVNTVIALALLHIKCRLDSELPVFFMNFYIHGKVNLITTYGFSRSDHHIISSIGHVVNTRNLITHT